MIKKLSVLFPTMILLIGCVPEPNNSQVEVTALKEQIKKLSKDNIAMNKELDKPMLVLDIDNYYLNENNLKEIFFRFYIYNYGNTEAKNIEVTCVLYDEDDNIRLEKTEIVGNVASTSTKFHEIYSDYSNIKENEMIGPICMITKCNNCIILENKIPEVKNIYNKYTK